MQLPEETQPRFARFTGPLLHFHQTPRLSDDDWTATKWYAKTRPKTATASSCTPQMSSRSSMALGDLAARASDSLHYCFVSTQVEQRGGRVRCARLESVTRTCTAELVAIVHVQEAGGLRRCTVLTFFHDTLAPSVVLPLPFDDAPQPHKCCHLHVVCFHVRAPP